MCGLEIKGGWKTRMNELQLSSQMEISGGGIGTVVFVL